MLYLTHMGEHTTLYKIDSYIVIILYFTQVCAHTWVHRRNVTKKLGGGGGASKKTEFEVTCCTIVCRSGEFLMQFWRHRRTDCDRYQKGMNTIALQHSWKNSIGQKGGGGGGYEEYNIILSNYFWGFMCTFFVDPAPWREAGDVWCPPPVWNLRAVIWCPFSVTSCFFCLVLLLFLSCHFSANGPFSWLFQKTLRYILLRVRLYCMALVKQLWDGRWCVQLAAIWHWYLPLCI